MIDKMKPGDIGTRPHFPKRAIVTAGMPYGNKGLHFGHVAGVFVPADAYARFLRDRIGYDNVIFVSGTDCYGSPIDEGYRKLVQAGEFSGSLLDYVTLNHESQKDALDAYGISLDIFEGSGLGSSRLIHERTTAEFIRHLYENGHLEYRATAQFFDAEAGTFLNGRQVVGRCPVTGCKSEHAYADECDMGHQYMPEDLINPISTITGQVPEMRDVGNWYFNLPGFRELLGEYVEEMEERDDVRRVVTDTISEFLVPPVIFVKNECREDYESIRCRLPEHVFHEAEKGKQSFELAFADINLRDEARDILSEEGIRYRTGKALVPFRLTGNIEWGVPAPRLEDEESLTVWCWPESLWAPISFTRAFLAAHGHGDDEWRDWWCTSEARVFQFIGQDNIYFYGVAQPAMWSAMQSGHAPRPDGDEGELRQSTLIANHHVLFMNKKASSSGSVKPPMAIELLDHYTPEQLRAHFLSLGLGIKSVSFSPKSYDPDALAVRESDPERYSKIADPVLKDGQPLTNVLNRLVRSALYAAQKASGVTVDNERTGEVANGAVSYLPLVDPSPELVGNARETLLRYELLMYRTEMHTATNTVFDYIRGASKYANAHCTPPKDGVATDRQLADYFFLVRICAMLVHPIAPAGAEMIAGYLGFDPRELFAWEKTVTDDGIVDIAEFCTDEERRAGRHALVTLLPRVDFFEKHPSQY